MNAELNTANIMFMTWQLRSTQSDSMGANTYILNKNLLNTDEVVSNVALSWTSSSTMSMQHNTTSVLKYI